MSCPKSAQCGFMGSYVAPTVTGVGAPLYRNPGTGASPLPAAPSASVAASPGPLDGQYGLSSRSMCPSGSPSAGFDQVLVSAPTDLLRIDGLLMDGFSLTTTRRQTRDLRGDVPNTPVFSQSGDEPGVKESGAFGGMRISDAGNGPYSFRKPLRTFVV